MDTLTDGRRRSYARAHAVVGVVLAFALGLLALGCGGESTDVAAIESEVRAASVAWDEAHNAGDLDRLMSLYAEDAVSMPFERPALEGKDAVEEDFGAYFADFDARHKTTIVGLEIADDWAIERGAYTLTATAKDGDGGFEEAGKHIVVRRKDGDGWKVVWEIWNVDAPTE